MFPKNPSGDQYPDLYEEVAAKHYDVASVFGTPAPKPSNFHRPRSDHKPEFVTVVKRKRHFTRPGEEPKLRAPGDAITADNLFKPRVREEAPSPAQVFRPKP